MPHVNPFSNQVKIRELPTPSSGKILNTSEKEETYRTRADFENADDYALYCRRSGIESEDRFGRPVFMALSGTGPNVALHNGIHGHDEAAYLALRMGSLDAAHVDLHARARRTERKDRLAPYLEVSEVRCLYDTASFLGQEHGLFFNAFVTLSYRALHLSDPSKMTAILTAFLTEADGQLSRWGHPFHWIYVHENSVENGLHTHILAHIPAAVRDRFKEWARDGNRSFFQRHCDERSEEAVDIVIKKPDHLRSAAGWQADRIQYVTKGLDPRAMGRDPFNGTLQTLFDLWQQKDNYRRPAGVVPFRQRIGGSSRIWKRARKHVADEGMPMLSAFGDRAWPALRLDPSNFGWELLEHEARGKERLMRASQNLSFGDDELLSELRAAGLHGPYGTGKTDRECSEEQRIYRRLRDKRAKEANERHPYLWDRTWVGWWVTLPQLRRWGSLNVRHGLEALERHV